MMKIKNLAMVSLLLAGVQSFASEGFIGIEGGYASIQGDTFTQLDYESNDVLMGLRLGAQNDDFRSTISFNYYDSDEQNVELALLTVDHFFLGQTEKAYRPFVGLAFGYGNYESDFVEESDFVYGGQIGVDYRINENVSFDLGYRYLLSSADALDSVGNAFLGINYRF